MLMINILGPGCQNCQKVEAIARQAVESMGIEAEFIKFTDYNQIMQYNILSTPGLVINEQVMSSGRIPNQAEVTAWVTTAANSSSAN
jgi:small redox-active disulfide protein 2